MVVKGLVDNVFAEKTLVPAIKNILRPCICDFGMRGYACCFRLVKLEKELIKAAAEKFSLRQLYKEPSISSVQMIRSCNRLLEESLPYLEGMHLCISHFYSVLQDGELCIPWNWKSGGST